MPHIQFAINIAFTDYYPFGSPMPERNSNSADYRFGFNGKENDNEVKGIGNQQDYGMRIYDPRIARFLSADPLIVQGQQYPWYSPYQFAGNKPIQFIDLDGLEELDPYVLQMSLGTDAYLELQNQRTTMTNTLVFNATSNIAKPFVIVGTGVFNPIVGNIIDGCNGNKPYPSYWAPRSLENWSLVRKPQWLDENIPFDDGKEILYSTFAVELTFFPTKFSAPDGLKNTIKNDVVADKLVGFGLKSGFKFVAKQVLNQESVSTSSSDERKPSIYKSSNTSSSTYLGGWYGLIYGTNTEQNTEKKTEVVEQSSGLTKTTKNSY
ncbi:MAG: RHS repeat domain-containing protein [Bacteroidales bacterium]